MQATFCKGDFEQQKAHLFLLRSGNPVDHFADVVAKKDVDKALNDRAVWRSDERRWCREAKLPQPGWWLE